MKASSNRVIANFLRNGRLITGVLESHNMTSTPKGMRQSGSPALNSGVNPSLGLEFPADVSRGGNVKVDLVQSTRHYSICLFLLTNFDQVGITGCGDL